MAVSTVMSRYAVLSVEESEDEGEFQEVAKRKGKAVNQKAPETSGSKKKKNQKRKKAEAKAEADELKQLAFGGGKGNKSKPHKFLLNGVTTQKSNDAPGAMEQQYEEWKKRDAEFVEESFENQMQEALLMSKLDYEKKKVYYDHIHAQNTNDNSTAKPTKNKKSSKKKDKPNNTVSLAEFNNMLPSQVDKVGSGEERLQPPREQKSATPPQEKEFFEKLDKDVQKAIQREHHLDSYQGEEGKKAFLAEQARSLQMDELLQEKNTEIERLKSEVDELTEELQKVRKRNKKLCAILGQSEVRAKAEILVQVEKLTDVRDELTAQVSDLHQQLEQERSKVSQLTTQNNKLQGNRKRTPSEATQ